MATYVPGTEEKELRKVIMSLQQVGAGVDSATAKLGWTNTRLAKTSAYTLANADKGSTVALGGSALYSLVIPNASGFDANFEVVIINEDTGASALAKTLLPYYTSSSTSLTIGTGSKAFTVASGLQFGQFGRWRAYSLADSTKWMAGKVSYSGTTLTITVDDTNGSGTITDWQIAPEYLLYPGQIAMLINQNSVWFYSRSRWKVPNNQIVYLDAISGRQSNDGLSAATAIKSADILLRNVVKDYFDFSGVSSYPTALMTVQLADNATAGVANSNAYSGFHIAFTPVGNEGRGCIVINGNSSDPSKTVIADTGGEGIGAFGQVNIEVSNVQIGQTGAATPAANTGLAASDGANIYARAGVIFGTVTNQQIITTAGGKITFLSNISIVGGALQMIYASGPGSIVDMSSCNITFSNSPAYSNLVVLAIEQGSVIIPTVGTWANTGTVTGTKYYERNLSLIYTNGGTVPGSAAGSTDGTGKVG